MISPVSIGHYGARDRQAGPCAGLTVVANVIDACNSPGERNVAELLRASVRAGPFTRPASGATSGPLVAAIDTRPTELGRGKGVAMSSPVNNAEARKDIPVPGVAYLTPLYDSAIARLTRENSWRGALVNAMDHRPRVHILDVGCGTGTLALPMKAPRADASVIGIDPDSDVLRRTVAKAAAQPRPAKWNQGFVVAESAENIRPRSKGVSSLVFRQIPDKEEVRVLDDIVQSLQPGGHLCIADYGEQGSRLARWLFHLTVQMPDGVENTTSNVQGLLPVLVKACGLENVEALPVVATPTGSISLDRGRKPQKGLPDESH